VEWIADKLHKTKNTINRPTQGLSSFCNVFFFNKFILQFSFEGAVEDGGEEGVQLGGGLGLQAL
jgi:hypothetical protein